MAYMWLKFISTIIPVFYVHICVGRYFNLGGALALRFAQCTRLGGSGGMIFAKLAELVMCRISGEEEVKKTRGAPAPGAPLFPTPVMLVNLYMTPLR